MTGTFWAILPPVIAIVLALITKEVYLSLMIGIASGALMYHNFHLSNGYHFCDHGRENWS